MSESKGIERLRELVATRKRTNAEIDAVLIELLSSGEYVEDIAAALDESREKVRRFRVAHNIPDAREIRRTEGRPRRRPSAS